MKKTALILFLLLSGAFVIAQEKPRRDLGADPSNRGRYLVEQVAMCVECHTPRDRSGQLIRNRYLGGAPVPVKAPPFPNIRWAIKAPAIAGLPGYTQEQGVRLLTQGITADGRTPDPPMPAFRFTRSDAEAVVTYLKSLE